MSNTVGILAPPAGGSASATGPTNPLYFADAFQAPTSTTYTSTNGVLNAASTVTTSGYDTVLVTIVPSGTITAGAVVFEGFDGTTWIGIKAPRADSYYTDNTFTLSGSPGTHAWQVPVAGFPQFLVRFSAALTGSGNAIISTAVSSAPDVSIVTVGVDPGTGISLNAPPTSTWQYNTNGTPITTATSTVMAAAPGAGLRNYLTDIFVNNSGTTGSEIQILDGTTVVWDGFVGASNAGGISVRLITPIRAQTANQTMSIKTITGTALSAIVSCQGLVAP